MDNDFVKGLIKLTIINGVGNKAFEKICLKEKYRDIYDSYKERGEFDGNYLNPGKYTIFTNKVYVSFDGCLEQGDCIDYDTFTI